MLHVEPGAKGELHVYASVGASVLDPDRARLEFVLACDAPTDRAVELLTMAAWYHHTDGLGLDHSLPIGEPWLPGSMCDHLLVCRPYPFGPELE